MKHSSRGEGSTFIGLADMAAESGHAPANTQALLRVFVSTLLLLPRVQHNMQSGGPFIPGV